jgi:hypothetical protein
MTHYLTAELNGGVYHGTRILPAADLRETQAPLVSTGGQTPVPGATSYGLGWGVGTVNGTRVVVHDGQLRDFDAAAAILPADRTAVVVLMNTNPELVVNDDRLYNGIMQGITTGTFPGVSHTFTIFYAVFDAIAAATLILMIFSLARTGRWRRKFQARAARTGFWPAAVRAVGLDLVIAAAVAAAVTFGVGALVGYVPLTPTLLVFAAPDIAVWIYAVVVFFAVRAVVRAVTIGAGRRTPQPAAPQSAEPVVSS